MPRKERPAPLSDSIFRAKLERDKQKLPSPIGPVFDDVPEEIPVHNTFIQFGASTGLELQKQLSTAPAWIGPSLQSMIQSAVRGAVEASPKKVPLMRYSLSASSARAAGVPTANAVVACYEPWLESEKVARAFGHELATTQTTQVGTDEAEDVESGEGEQRRDAAALANLGDLPSVGSEKHAEGQCKRCCFFPKGRCLNGSSCEFCHLPHEKRKRKKKKKKKSGTPDKDDSDSEDSDDDEDTTPADCLPSSPPERKRPGGSSAFGRSPPSQALSTLPPSSRGLSASQLSMLESPPSAVHPRQIGGLAAVPPTSRGGLPIVGENSGSPKGDNIPSMPSTASSVPNWPRPAYEVEGWYQYAPPYSPGAYARGVPPPPVHPPVTPPASIGPADIAGAVDPRLPLYSPPYEYRGAAGYLAPAQAAGSPFGGGRPPPR